MTGGIEANILQLQECIPLASSLMTVKHSPDTDLQLEQT
jgi:hypothetical protein